MSKYSSKGTLLQRSIASVFTTVGSIMSLQGPSAEVQFFDGSALDSGVSLEDGELTGHTAPGEVSGELFWDPGDSTHQTLTDDLGAPAHASWKIVTPAGSNVITFTGATKNFTPQAAVKDGLKSSFAIKLRSLATYPT
jgi:hypothetical protein